jgi:hypothetical protein
MSYTLSNLGEENFNETSLNDITSPIYAKIQDSDDAISQLSLTADQFLVRLEDNEDNVSEILQTVNSITLSATSVTGGASLQIKADGEGIGTAISITVSNEDTESFITVTAGETQIKSPAITLGGKVVFTDGLLDGSTEIVGDCITSGTIRGITLWSHSAHNESYDSNGYNGYYGQSSQIYNGSILFSYITTGGSKTDFGGMYADYDNQKMYVYSSSSKPLKLSSASNMSLDASGYIYLGIDGVGDTRICACNHLTDLVSGQTVWQFADDGIYFNGVKKVSV